MTRSPPPEPTRNLHLKSGEPLPGDGADVLEGLTWDGCYLEDLGPLARLAHLKELSLALGNNPPLDPLGKLMFLQDLSLSFPNYKGPVRLKPLAALARLRKLRLNGPTIQDLRPLSRLPQLEELDLSIANGATTPADLSPLAALVHLQRLSIHYSRIDDFSSLARLTALSSLDLTSCSIADLAPLAGLSRLRHLSLAGSEKVHDLAPLARLAHLESLNVDGCKAIQSIEPLSRLTQLRELVLGSQKEIRDYGPLAKLPQLTSPMRLVLSAPPIPIAVSWTSATSCDELLAFARKIQKAVYPGLASTEVWHEEAKSPDSLRWWSEQSSRLYPAPGRSGFGCFTSSRTESTEADAGFGYLDTGEQTEQIIGVKIYGLPPGEFFYLFLYERVGGMNQSPRELTLALNGAPRNIAVVANAFLERFKPPG